MILTQHYLGCLPRAPYLIGDETSGCAVADPRQTSAWASARGLSIEPITGTYVHADFLRGDPELAAQTSAAISFGEGAGTEFPIETLYDGPRLSLGELPLEILAAPELRAVTQGVAWHQMALLQRRQHNVGEAGNPPHFLPERYAQEGG